MAPYNPIDATLNKQLYATVEALLEEHPQIESLNSLEEQLLQAEENVPLLTHVAVKLARSKLIVQTLERPVHVSFTFAAYKESTRMLRPDQHPHGEDCLVRKVEQLQWLFDKTTPVTWDMIVVDDGCPEGSGKLAEQILKERCPDAPVRVLFLEEAIAKQLPITQPMVSAADSQKGGSVVYGMWAAVQEQHEQHIVVFTDADLSTHLGQTGLLIDGIVNEKRDAAIGSRREPTSVVVKTGHRNTRGKLFIYLWKGLLAPLHSITDTQCGFKAFTAETVRNEFDDMIEKRFAIDLELLLKTELQRSGSICKKAIAWIDSEAASTTTGIQPYLPMLRSVVGMYRKYLPVQPEADAWASFIESMTEAQWEYLSAHVPATIADAEPTDFGKNRSITVEELTAICAQASLQ